MVHATQHGGVPKLMALLEDPVTAVRDAAYRALIEAARFDGVRWGQRADSLHYMCFLLSPLISMFLP